MHKELTRKLYKNFNRLVNELNVSVSFLASLMAKEVINDENKAAIKVSNWKQFSNYLHDIFYVCRS